MPLKSSKKQKSVRLKKKNKSLTRPKKQKRKLPICDDEGVDDEVKYQ